MSIEVAKNNRQRQFILGGTVLTLLLAGSLLAPTPARAIVPQTLVSQASRVEIPTEELQQFANAVKQLQAIQQESEEAMVQVVLNEGFSIERFGEIIEWKRNPGSRPTAEVTTEEMQSFEKAIARIETLQQQAESKMEQAVKAEGLDLRRFRQIGEAVRQDRALQRQVQQMTQN